MLIGLIMMLETQEDKNIIVSIYEEYAVLLNVVARKNLYDSSFVDDCVQETFLKLIKSFEIFKTISKECQRSYILTICRRTAYRINNKNSGVISIEELNNTEIADNEYDFSAYDKSDIASVLNMLDEKYREPVVMKYMEELTILEISKILGISENLVLQRIHRGKKHLHKILVGDENDKK